MLRDTHPNSHVDKPHERCECMRVMFTVRLHPELSDLLERFAASQNVTAETIIAESVRAYLGVDA